MLYTIKIMKNVKISNHPEVVASFPFVFIYGKLSLEISKTQLTGHVTIGVKLFGDVHSFDNLSDWSLPQLSSQIWRTAITEEHLGGSRVRSTPGVRNDSGMKFDGRVLFGIVLDRFLGEVLEFLVFRIRYTELHQEIRDGPKKMRIVVKMALVEFHGSVVTVWRPFLRLKEGRNHGTVSLYTYRCDFSWLVVP